MSTVASAPRARRDQGPAAPVRHGKCSLRLSIGGTEYRITPLTPPAGIKVAWTLRKQSPDGSAVYQVSVEKSEPPACSCPDCSISGAICKHIGALRALGLIPGRKPRPAAARRSHARRLAEAPVPAPVETPARRAAGSFAAGFGRAVSVHISRLRGEPRPAPESPACAICGAGFDPVVSRDPLCCESCAEGETR